MGKLLVALTLIIVMPGRAAGQTLQIDPARDLGLQATVRAFLDGALTANQLETELREYARAFEARPYKVDTAAIDRTVLSHVAWIRNGSTGYRFGLAAAYA